MMVVIVVVMMMLMVVMTIDGVMVMASSNHAQHSKWDGGKLK